MAPKNSRKSHTPRGPQLKTITFKIKRSSRLYLKFLTAIRCAVSTRMISGKHVTGMPAKEIEDLKLIDLKLETDTRTITVRIQASDCYIWGFKKGSNGRWYVFKRKFVREVMSESDVTYLNGGFGYGDWGTLSKAKFGYPQFITAINRLDTLEKTDDMKEHLMNLCVFVIESARFCEIEKEACRCMRYAKALDVVQGEDSDDEFHIGEEATINQGSEISHLNRLEILLGSAVPKAIEEVKNKKKAETGNNQG